jgi:DNA-binding transcriptional MerR regulator
VNIKILLSETFSKKKHFFSFSEILAMNQKEQLHSIQQLSMKLNIPKPTLRYWEKEFEGILVPLRTHGGQRRYTSEHIFIIEEIKMLKKEGLSLAEIKRKFDNSHIRNTSNREDIDFLAVRVADGLDRLVINFAKRCSNDISPKN